MRRYLRVGVHKYRTQRAIRRQTHRDVLPVALVCARPLEKRDNGAYATALELHTGHGGGFTIVGIEEVVLDVDLLCVIVLNHMRVYRHTLEVLHASIGGLFVVLTGCNVEVTVLFRRVLQGLIII